MKFGKCSWTILEQVMKIEMRISPARWTETGFFLHFSDPSGYVISDSGGRRRDPWVLWCCDGTGRRRYYECICEKRQAEPWYRQASGAGADQNNE